MANPYPCKQDLNETKVLFLQRTFLSIENDMARNKITDGEKQNHSWAVKRMTKKGCFIDKQP